MRALVYYGARDIRCEAVADPKLSDPKSAIVKIKLCALCGSDLHPYHVDNGRRGYCMGHEAIGEVVEVGAEVRDFRRGDRVFLPGSLSCGNCKPCSAGLTMQCANYPLPRAYGQGLFGVGGCQADAVETPSADANLRKLPDAVSDELGLLLTDTLPTAWQCASRAGVRAGATVAVIGLGAVGQQCLLSAFAMGSERAFGVDPLLERREAAAALGAIPVTPEASIDAVLAATGGAGVDVVLNAHGSPETVDLGVRLARKGGALSIVGVSEVPSFPFPAMLALSKNLDISFVSCSIQAQLPSIMDALQRGALKAAPLEALITHRMPLSQGAEAYALFDQRRDGVKKIALIP